MADQILLVLVSFLASVGFGTVFRIHGKDLLLAGLGGALTRIVLILLLTFIDTRVVYMIIAAFFASSYGEFWATKKRYPSTYFIYPAIVPLIPGDLFYYTIIGMIKADNEAVMQNGLNCFVALIGMGVGFVLSAWFANTVRKIMAGVSMTI